MTMTTNYKLVEWIRELEKQGNLYKFYKGKEWQTLKEEVLREQNHECQRCKEKGRYTKADTVHHINEVRKQPQLALSKYYVDENGKEQRNLIAICKVCHNIEHDRFNSGSTKELLNIERW